MEQVIEQMEDKKHSHPVEITVNERSVTLPQKDTTGQAIKQAAIAQGVPIRADFVLQQELPNGGQKVVGDNDPIKVHPHERFTAIDRDDNS